MNKPIESFRGRPIVAHACRCHGDAGRCPPRRGDHRVDFAIRYPMKCRTPLRMRWPITNCFIFRNQDISSENLIDFGRRCRRVDRASVCAEDKDISVLIKFRNDETNPPFRTDVWHSGRDLPQGAAEKPRLWSPRRCRQSAATRCLPACRLPSKVLSDRMQHFISVLEAIHDFKPFPRAVRRVRGGSEERPCAGRCCTRRPFIRLVRSSTR